MTHNTPSPGDEPPSGRLRPTSWRLLLAIVIVSGALAYALIESLYTQLPILPWTAIPTIVLLALAEGITAYHTRRRIRRVPGTEPIEPLNAARLLALAKASALFAAMVIGVFAGMALSLVGMLTIPAPRADALTATGMLLAGGLLLAAALFLEHACRVPPDEQEQSRSADPQQR
ncbi:DUF3180 domain-containing protein [Salinactinospora qingdaonensis]|uniref:DUF3180 domain-containing protein n=1 Tax=Salinactinospora qingdaonensis TaxID=702744 RepID=A0ABP7G4U5_9ACTN